MSFLFVISLLSVYTFSCVFKMLSVFHYCEWVNAFMFSDLTVIVMCSLFCTFVEPYGWFYMVKFLFTRLYSFSQLFRYYSTMMLSQQIQWQQKDKLKSSTKCQCEVEFWSSSELEKRDKCLVPSPIFYWLTFRWA